MNSRGVVSSGGRPTIDVDISSPARYADPAVLDSEFMRLRRDCPVGWVDREPYRPFWAIVRHQDILAIERQHDLFINEPRLCLIPREVEAAAMSPLAGGVGETLKVLRALARLSQRPVGDLVDWLQARAANRGRGRQIGRAHV